MEDKIRFVDDIAWKLAENILIVCPSCGSKALVKDSKASCLKCGFSKVGARQKWYGHCMGSCKKLC